MSVIAELFENYDHIPLEFRRQLLMMRELDDTSNRNPSPNTHLGLIRERDFLKKEILRKHPGESQEQEEARIRAQYD
jgi:hypothetical protein